METRLLVVALLTAISIVATACGSDQDEPVTVEEQPSSKTFLEVIGKSTYDHMRQVSETLDETNCELAQEGLSSADREQLTRLFEYNTNIYKDLRVSVVAKAGSEGIDADFLIKVDQNQAGQYECGSLILPEDPG